MKWTQKVTEKFADDVSTKALINIILILLVVLLILNTDTVWKGLLSKAWAVITPFFFGFAVAYVIRPIIRSLEHKKVTRRIVIPVIYIIACALILWLLFTLVPLVYSHLTSFINSIISGVSWLYSGYAASAANGVPAWLKDFVTQAIATLNDTKNLIPNLTKTLPEIFNSTLKIITNILFTIFISIYMAFDWEHITGGIVNLFKKKNPNSLHYLYAVNLEIGSYIRSLLILMVIKFVEYALLYFLIGHPDWLILALLTSIGLIVPYLGPIAANVIALLTALTLSPGQIIAVIAVILIMSNVDEYVITPMVHSRNVKISPLWALFSVFCGGTLFGTVGVMLAIPAFLAIRCIIQMNNSDKKTDPENA